MMMMRFRTRQGRKVMWRCVFLLVLAAAFLLPEVMEEVEEKEDKNQVSMSISSSNINTSSNISHVVNTAAFLFAVVLPPRLPIVALEHARQAGPCPTVDVNVNVNVNVNDHFQNASDITFDTTTLVEYDGLLLALLCLMLMASCIVGLLRRLLGMIPKTDNVVLFGLKRHAILGEGSFGQVLLVSEEAPTEHELADGNGNGTTRRAYALKIQSKGNYMLNAYIMNELAIMKKLQHPFIVNLVNDFQDRDNVYFQLPLLQGGELSRLLKDRDGNSCALPEANARFYSLCIADALAYMHGLKIAHRDLKPSNIMIDGRGYPVLVDLGIAKFMHEEKTHTYCGTVEYMAPEVIHKLKRGHDCSVDHWAFGALVYELVTGSTLFDSSDERWKSRWITILRGNFKISKDASKKVIHLIRKLLVRNPARRLGSLKRGEQGILEHPWFEGLDLVSLRERTIENVPWVPTIRGPLDASYFPDATNFG